jgi:PAS domain S-box-containing protein
MFQQEFADVTEPAPLRFDRDNHEIVPMLSEALGAMVDGIVVTDLGGRIVFFNAAFEEMMTAVLRRRIALGAAIAEVLPVDQADQVELELEPGIWIDVRHTRLGSGACFTTRDISTSKARELASREKEEFYRNVINTQTEFVVRFTPDGRVTFSNDAYCRYMGRAPGELSGESSDFDFIEEADKQEHLDHIRSLTPDNPTRTVIFRSTVGDDGQKWEEWTDTGVFAADGTLIELQAVGRDVTDRRLAEIHLAESEERYRTVVNTQTEFVARFRPDGRTTFANDAYCRYMGMDMAQLAGIEFSLFDNVHPDDRARHDRHVAALTPAHPTDTLVIRTVMPDGSTHWEHWVDTGVFDEQGRLVEIQAIGRDITRERETEEALERQRDALHQTEKLAALGSLLAGVAHELNNPLSIVVGYSGLLHESAEDEATRRRAKEVHVAAERCARIIKTFLAMARSKPAIRSAVDIEAQLDSVLELTSYGVRTSGIEIVRRFAGNLPTTLGDADQLHQVFMNLVLNAQQAMVAVAGPRRLTLATAVRQGMLEIEIADTGTGMPEHVLARAFEPFFTTKPQGVGTGIGLSVCLGIVEAHAGRIEVDSTVGQGTRFRVTLPVVQGEGVADVEQQALPELVGSVLVVDDEPAIADLVAMALRRRGVSVSTAMGGLDAIRSIEAQQFDAVITDLRMADLGGDKLIEIISVLRPELAGRVIVMTGDALGGGIALKQSSVTVLEKPLDLEALYAALTPLLKVH